MTRGEDSGPTIRILLLGAHGVGKNCLESRFTTGQWPPSYDPSLTLCSRRFYTFRHGVEDQGGSSALERTKVLDESPDSSDFPTWKSSSSFSHSSKDRPLPPEPDTRTPSLVPASPVLEKNIHSTSTCSIESNSSNCDAGGDDAAAAAVTGSPKPCAGCLERSRTHLIEIINYPLLHHAATRRKVLSTGEYDAVVLVYDVGCRASFEHVKVLLAEAGSLSAHQRLQRAIATRHNTRSRRRSLLNRFGGAPGDEGKDAMGRREEDVRTTVVAVVGNKCDFDDADYAPPRCEGKDDGRDENFKIVDHALLLSGRPYVHDAAVEQGSLIAPFSLSRTYQYRTALLRSDASTDTIDKFFQLGRNGRPVEIIATKEEATTGLTTPGSRMMANTSMQRQVSKVEGEALVPNFGTHVPFFEASAKTGKNVEEMFEAVAKAVLKGMGAVDSVELAKRCPHRCRVGGRQHGKTRLGTRDAASVLDLSVPGLALRCNEVKNSDIVRPVEIKLFDGGNIAKVLEQPLRKQSVGERYPRVEKVVERMRNLFVKKSLVGGGVAS